MENEQWSEIIRGIALNQVKLAARLDALDGAVTMLGMMAGVEGAGVEKILKETYATCFEHRMVALEDAVGPALAAMLGAETNQPGSDTSGS